MCSLRRSLQYCICILWLICSVFGFNVQVKSPRVITGFATKGSYFGYTVKVAPTRTETWILVGSPRSNDTHMAGVQQPGAVYRCNLSREGVPDCIALNIDSNTGYDVIEYDHKKLGVKHGKTNAWLGGSMAVAPPPDMGFTTCAHKWYNRQFPGKYYMAGMCYEIPLDFNMENVRKLPAFINGPEIAINVSGEYILNYAYAGSGASVHYAKGESSGMDHLLIGATGLMDWIGGFVDIQGTRGRVMKNNVTDTSFTRPYLGFATTSGKYFNDGITYFAFGAPRSDLTGMVVFFNSFDREYSLQKPAMKLQGKDENNEDLPPNAYFGATLYSVDVNNDVADDLLVGSPLYSPLNSDKVFNDVIDLGLVAVYMGSRHSSEFPHHPRILKGVEPRGRFGTAIESLGDINGDMYNDIAIGAPYENNNRGAVYIFNGYSEGLWPEFTQRIQASELNIGLFGFGISMSSGTDLNGDNINDVLVGSYLSDDVIIFLGQPVLDVDGQLNIRDVYNAQTDLLDIDETNTTVEVCFRFDDRHCREVELTITTTLDVENEKHARIRFAENNRREFTETLRVHYGMDMCTQPSRIYAVPTIDYVSDILITSEYTVKDIICPSYDVTATISRFHGNNPSDPRLILQKEMQFRKLCPNNRCYTDLKLSADAIYVNSHGYYLIGNQDLAIDVTITKTGNPSYGSSFHLVYPSYLSYTKLEKVFGDTHVTCSLLDKKANETDIEIPMSDDEAGLNCFYGNPMTNDSGVGFLIHMRVPPIVSVPNMLIKMLVKTMSIEQDSRDNRQDLIINMTHHVEAIFSGIATEDLVFIEDNSEDTTTIEHIYELDNRGPSVLMEASVNISYPAYSLLGKPMMYLNSTETRCLGSCDIRCYIHNTHTAPVVYQYRNGRMISITDTYTEDMETVDKKNCVDENCPMVQCNIKNVQAQKSAVIYLMFALKKDIRKSLGEGKVMAFVSHATVQINEEKLISNRTYFEQQLTTSVRERVIVKKVFPWWIIVVSILAGLLLIVILILILWKVGFFKRKSRDQVREMRKSRPPPASGQVVNGESNGKEKGRDSYTDSEDGIVDNEQQPAKSE